MKIFRSYKTELAPNNVQRTSFVKAAGVRRFVYNWGLSRRIEEYRTTGRSNNAFEQDKQLNAIKAIEFPWMYEVSKCVPQAALSDLDRAYGNFFRRLRAKEKPGFPKFKSKKDNPRFRFSSRCPVALDRIRLPKIGWVRLKEKGYIPISGTIGIKQLSTTVKGTGSGRWFVNVQCEVEIDSPVSPPETKVDSLGIDLGLTYFATLFDGTKFISPRPLKRMQKKLARLQRGLSRKAKGSSNRQKAVKRLSIMQFRIACQRKDFVHKLTSLLVKTKPAMKYVLEGLKVQNMMRNHRLAGAIADSGWDMFRQQMKYKAKWAGKSVLEADQFFPSSKMCSKCRSVNFSLTLEDRIFVCPACGFMVDRDVNAAVNLTNYEKYLADGTWSPRSKPDLPSVRRKVTPVERKGTKQPQGNRNKARMPPVVSTNFGSIR